MATLQLEHVVKIFRGNVRAVDDLTLELADGELLVLVGPSGCGKTTTLRMIAGLERLTQGRICVGRRCLNGLLPRDRDVAMVFQNHALYPHMSVRDNLAFGLKMRRTPAAQIEQRVAETADVLGIGPLLWRRPGELSGGQQQRVALGRAIVRRPKVFLLDEPLSNLDARLRDQLRWEIRRIHARLGVTMLYVTHDQTEAMTLGQRIAVLGEGRLQQVAEPTTLYERPANRFVAGLIGSPAMNFLEGRIQRRDDWLVFCTTPGGEDEDRGDIALPIPKTWTARLGPYADRPITLGIRPEHIGLPAGERSAEVPRIPATVEAIEPVGPQIYVHLNTGRHTFVVRMDAGGSGRVGERIEPAVATGRLHFFDPQTGNTVA